MSSTIMYKTCELVNRVALKTLPNTRCYFTPANKTDFQNSICKLKNNTQTENSLEIQTRFTNKIINKIIITLWLSRLHPKAYLGARGPLSRIIYQKLFLTHITTASLSEIFSYVH